MQTGKRVAICLMLTIWCLTGMAAAQKTTCEPSKSAMKLAAGNNAFTLNLYRQLSTAKGNLFFSPYSIRTALAMTSSGARGQTLMQMKAALGFALDDTEYHKNLAASIHALNTGSNDNYDINIANSLWVEKTHAFLQQFIDTNKKAYGAGLEQIDFIRAAENARLKINAWVEEQTRQKITNLIPPGGVNADTRLALINAVYFKGLWAEQFEKNLTRKQPFHLDDGQAREVPLMTFSKPMNLPFLAEDGIKILELDYRSKDISMLILLPDTSAGLSALETRLNETQLSSWIGRLKKQMVRVHVPRFSMTWGAENMVPHLRALGMQDAFIKGAANFSGIDGTRDLLITSVFHKAFVDVNEEGTEAAAATGVIVGVTSMPPPPEIFRADRPFLFLLREKKTGTILFMGRMTEPEEN